MSEPATQLLTTGDVAKLAGVSANAVFHWVKTKKLEPCAITRGGVQLFRRGDVDAWLAKRMEAKRANDDA